MLHSRIERVQHLLRSEIGRIIDQDLRDPNLPPFITVHQVKVSKDLSQAVVAITFLEDQSEEVVRETVDELNHCAPYIQKLMTRRVVLKRHPKLKFVYTSSTRNALELEHIFQQLKREEAPLEGDERETDAESS